MGRMNMKEKLKGCMMHQRDNWKTPKITYEAFMSQGYYDPCPTDPKQDGLKIDWKKKNFVNPPYSQIEKWVDKAIEESEKGNITALLVPARTDTKWFHKLLNYGCVFAFVKGRIKFDDGKNGAPFPSVFILVSKVDKIYQISTIQPWNK